MTLNSIVEMRSVVVKGGSVLLPVTLSVELTSTDYQHFYR